MRVKIICLILIFFVCLSAETPAHAEANEQALDQARALIDAGQPEGARELLVPYLSSGGVQQDYAEYLLALTSFADSDADSPKRAVDSLRRRYPASRFAPMAMYRLAQYYRVSLRDSNRAIAVYSQFLQAYPRDVLAHEAQMWLASALIDAGQYDHAISTIHQAFAIYNYDPQERSVLEGLLEFAKQNAGRPPAGSATIDVKPSSTPRPEEQTYTAAMPTEFVVAEKPVLSDLPSPTPAMDGQVSNGTGMSTVRQPPPVPRLRASTPAAPPPAPPAPPIQKFPEDEEVSEPEDMSPVAPARPIALEPYVIMDFRNVDLGEILSSMSQDLGVTFIKDPEVQGKMTIVQKPRLMTRSQALPVLESALKAKGYDMIFSQNAYHVVPPNKRFVKSSEDVRASPKPEKPESPIVDSARLRETIAQEQEPPLVEWPLGLESSSPREEWVKVYSLKEATAERLAGFLNTILEREMKRVSSAGSEPSAVVISADRMTNRLVVVGPKAFHDSILPLIQKLDYKGFSDFQVRVIPLKHALAADLAAKFDNIVKSEFPGRSDSAPAPILFQADARLNSLILSSSSQSLLKTFGDLAEVLDQPTPLKQFLEPPGRIKSLESLQDFMPK